MGKKADIFEQMEHLGFLKNRNKIYFLNNISHMNTFVVQLV